MAPGGSRRASARPSTPPGSGRRRSGARVGLTGGLARPAHHVTTLRSRGGPHRSGGTLSPEFPSCPPGTFSWVDPGAKEIAASNAFYSSLFGWGAEDQGDEAGNYTILSKAGKTVAGNMAVMAEGQPGAWPSY